MRIPSLKKIERQADAYVTTRFQIDPVDAHEMIVATALLRKLRNHWDSIRDGFCPRCHSEVPCTCKTHPRFQPLVMEQMQPLSDHLNEVYDRILRSKKRMRDRVWLELVQARTARMDHRDRGRGIFIKQRALLSGWTSTTA